MPKSSDFVEGYKNCLETFEVNPEFPLGTHNPYPKGSEQHEGWEQAYYDLTQK